MDLQECIQFANNYPTCSLATVDGDQARVRTLLMWFADETGFYFVTFSSKALSQQLRANPKVEVCFYNNPETFQGMRQMRLTGSVEFSGDDALIARAQQERAHYLKLAGQPTDAVLEVFRIGGGEIHFWTVKDFLKEAQIERVRF